MKAILVTQELKDSNPKLFSDYEVDDTALLNIPHKFNRGNRTFLGYELRADLQTEDGWGDLITPTYDDKTEKLGDIIPDGNNFTYEVITMTTQESEDYNEEKDENEAREKIDSYRLRGGELIEKTRTKMWGRIHLYSTGPMGLTKPQMAKVERWLKEVYFNLLTGNFRQAENEVLQVISDRDDVTGDSTLLEAAGMLDTVEWLRDQILDYNANTYDL